MTLARSEPTWFRLSALLVGSKESLSEDLTPLGLAESIWGLKIPWGGNPRVGSNPTAANHVVSHVFAYGRNSQGLALNIRLLVFRLISHGVASARTVQGVFSHSYC